jgi:hypothetical protein
MKRLIIPSLTSLALSAGLWLLAGPGGLWPLAIVVALAVDAPWRSRGRGDWPWLKLTASAAAIITLATYPTSNWLKLIIAVVLAAYRIWLDVEARPVVQGWVAQILALEAIFVWMAAAGLSRTIGAVLVWLAAFVTTRETIAETAGEMASTLAATWALVAAEIGWVLSAWLVTYVLFGIGLLVPQPALVLTGLAYCFGSIYLAQRRGELSRWRFAEFILVGVILIAIVVVGTNWKATV